ncbi:MAG: DUF4340 domain-containing protein [Acidobacteria bacterium]|nr:DUF4340 domain-containing protein [Acidobacteriota bacterium]
MKFKTTLIVFGIFAALLAAFLIFEAAGTRKEGTRDKLVTFSGEDVERMLFKTGGETLTFVKGDGGDWKITSPVEARGDKYEIDRLAGDFADLKYDRIVEEEAADLEKYGLPDKEITLFIKDAPQPVQIEIGMENPLDNSFFARRADSNKVVLISSFFKSILENTLFDFRDKEIFRFESDDVSSVTLKSQNGEWRSVKQEDEWWLESPVKSLAVKSRITGLLTSLSGLKAKEFMSEAKTEDDLETFGLSNPDYAVTLDLPAANQTLIFIFNEAEDSQADTTAEIKSVTEAPASLGETLSYVTSSLSDKIIAVENTIFTDLKGDPDEWREKKVADFYSWETNGLRIKTETMDLSLVKNDESVWFREGREDDTFDRDKVDDLIRGIQNLNADGFIDPPLALPELGLDKPKAEITIRTGSGDTAGEYVFLFGREDKEPGTVVVKNKRLDYVFRVKSEILEKIPASAEDLKPEETEEIKEGKPDDKKDDTTKK